MSVYVGTSMMQNHCFTFLFALTLRKPWKDVEQIFHSDANVIFYSAWHQLDGWVTGEKASRVTFENKNDTWSLNENMKNAITVL